MRRLVAGILCAVGLISCWQRQPKRPSIVLAVLDTLRADRLGGYGHPGRLTPALDRMSRAGTLFQAAMAQASWTKPSMASLLTSLYPTAHRALAGRAIDEGTPLGIDPLHEDLLTLPEALRGLGYRTGCFQTNANIKAEYGFAQGCEDYRFLGSDSSAPAVTAEGLRWLDEAGDSPAFLYVHYMEPHLPYTPPAPLERAYTSGRCTGQAAYNLETYRSIYNNLLNSNLGLAPFEPGLVPSAEQLEHWKGLYDGEVAALDEGLSALLAHVSRRPDTWMFVVADHGEQHLDHGAIGHGQALYQELIRVPLLVAGPGAPKGKIVETPVELIDLFPTVLDLLGEEKAAGRLEGQSWLPQLRPGTAPATRRPIFSEVDDSHAVRVRPLRMLLLGNLKLIDNEYREGGDHELYDLARDPGERKRLDAQKSPQREEMLEELSRRRRQDEERSAELPIAERVPLDAETLRQLKSLGYIQ